MKEGAQLSVDLEKMSFKRSRQNAEVSGSNTERMWDKMAWRSVDVAKENLGDYEDTVFFGLEELDGNAYKLRKTEKVIQSCFRRQTVHQQAKASARI